MTHDEMVKCQVWLSTFKREAELANHKEEANIYGIALSALDALINAGEVLPPKKAHNYFEGDVNLVEGKKNVPIVYWPLSKIEAYNLARSEDIAVLAKRLLKIKEILQAIPLDIHQAIKDYEYRGDDGDYTPNSQEEVLMEDFANGLIEDFIDIIPDAITQHLKGEVK